MLPGWINNKMLSHLWACIKGPKVYHVYTAVQNELSKPYPLNPLEHGSQQVIKGVTVLANISLYVSPMVLFYLWKKDYTIGMTCISIAKLTAGFTLLVLISMVIRGIGRSLNPTYSRFLDAIKAANVQHSKSNITHSIIASKYDCDFSALPVSFKMVGPIESPSPGPTFVSNYLTVTGLAVHLFGRHLIYPGSIRLLQAAIGQHLDEGRTNLITKSNGKRAKVVASDGNHIDTMFVDRRDRSTPQGSTLVLCCEGNAGFYEVGIVTTPLTAGYSVLGWNMPGFAYSTGLPFPGEVQQGADAVMQFAISTLGFTPDNILVYGWSIGGYPAAWLAQQYPDIRGLILDATFDHLLPLATPRMPAVMGGLVEAAIMGHFNLCNGDLVARYYGPVTVVRRKQDEIISIVEGDITTNRGNNLLELLLRSRYPSLFSAASEEVLRQYMHSTTEEQKAQLLYSHDVIAEDIMAVLSSYFGESVPCYPSELGDGATVEENTRVLLFLASKLLLDVEGGHPTPLDAKMFKQPWSMVADPSYVQVE